MTCDAVKTLLLERALAGHAVVERTEDGSLDEHLAACPECAATAADLEDVLGALAPALVAPAPPPAGVKERLLFETRAGRALPTFAAGVAKLLRIDEASARAALTRLEDPAAWRPGLCPGNLIRPIQPGPALGPKAMACFLRTAPSVTLPMHRHLGAETTFVLQGGYRDSGGAEVWAGEQASMPGASAHDLVVIGPEDCIALVVVDGGIVPV
jgi:putative transcriptional regulator